MEQVTLDLWPHPLTGEGRCTRLLSVAPGTTLAGLADDVGMLAADGVAIEVDGVAVARDAWERHPLPPGAVVVVRATGADGLRTLLQIATIVAALYVPTLGPIAAQAAWVGKAVSAGIMIGGNLVVNALVPPRVPEIGDGQRADDPIYSLAGGANSARPWQPMALVLGTHRLHPDLAGASYTELRGEDQYLLQIFDFGLGAALAVSDLHIGDTPLDEYQDVTLDWGLAGAPVTNVEGDVHTLVVAAELNWPDDEGATEADWIVRRSAAGAVRLILDFTGSLFRIDGTSVAQQTMDIQIGYRPIPTGSSAAPAWTDRTYTLQHGSRTPYRAAIEIAPATGQYDVRVRRTAAPPTALTDEARMSWAALRTLQADTADYAGRNRLGMVIRATAQLSGRLDRVSAQVSQHVPVWDAEASAWTAPQATSNPAWILRWLALGVWIGTEAEGDRRLIAGAGLDASQIDDDGLKLWGAWCDAEELSCDYVARGETLQRLFEIIAQCGRATLSWSTGRLGVVWDAADRPATALVTPANIVTGSYRTQWSGERVADEIVGRYIDRDSGWERREVRRIAPGATTVQVSTSIDLPGVTTREQAQREVNLQAARQVYHRRRHDWEMPIDALPAGRGDVVYVTHSLIDGGQAGRLRQVGPGDEVTLPEPVTLGADPHLLVGLPDGSLYQSTALAHPAGVVSPSARLLLTPPLPAPAAGAWDPLDCIWRYHGGDDPPAAVRIVSITPSEEGIVRLAAIDETPLYYAAKDLPTDVPLPLPGSRIPVILSAIFDAHYISIEGGYLADISVVLITDGDWRGGVVYVAVGAHDDRRLVARMVDGDVTASWIEPVIGAGGRTITVTIVPGTAAVPLGRPYVTRYLLDPSGAIGGPTPPPPTGFRHESLPNGRNEWSWTMPDYPDLSGIEIRYALTGGTPPQ